jgi:hypothetical protein
LGISLFSLYDTGSNDDTLQILKPYMDNGIVDLHQWGVPNRMSAQNDCLYRYKQSTNWQAFFDTNEFMWYNSTKFANVDELIKSDPRKAKGFEIMSFAMGGEHFNSDFVLEQFNRRQNRFLQSKPVASSRAVSMVGYHHIIKLFKGSRTKKWKNNLVLFNYPHEQTTSTEQFKIKDDRMMKVIPIIKQRVSCMQQVIQKNKHFNECDISYQ